MCEDREMRRFVFGLLAACGGGGGDTPVDAPVSIDSPPNNPACLISSNYGDLGTKTGTTTLGPSTATIVLDPGPPRDSFFMKLTTGKGVFAAGLATGTFTIAGAELAQSTCGLCVNILADISTGGPSKFFFATGGTVTLTSHTPPIGTLSNVALHEVAVDGTPISGGCTTSISAMAFSAQ